MSTKGLLDFDILRPKYNSTVASGEDIIIIIIFESKLYCICVDQLEISLSVHDSLA